MGSFNRPLEVVMCFVVEAANHNGNEFKMHFDNSHDAHVAVKAIEKANETLESDCKFYGHVQSTENLSDKDTHLILIF